MNRSANWLLSALLLTSTPVFAQLLDGCPSELIAGKFQEFGNTGKMPPDLGQWLSNEDAQYIEPGAVFDNVDYVGICWVSAWLVHTDEGVVLIDTLYGPFVEQLLENIARVDVDPVDIKYVLMTHGHFDHTGGAAIVKAQFPNAQFVMTKTGWDEAVANAAASKLGRRAWDMIEPEIVIEDGESIEFGGNTFTAISTPGHTWGTTSYTYDVVDNGNTYRSVTIGGLGLNAIEGAAQVEAYIESIDKIRARVNDDEQPVLVHLSTHGFSNNLPENREKLAAQKPDEQNVFVNPEALKNQISELRKGAVERLELEISK
ncbi:MAG: MBL fold metallo-hydrolase [Granulosicoccus sp.]